MRKYSFYGIMLKLGALFALDGALDSRHRFTFLGSASRYNSDLHFPVSADRSIGAGYLPRTKRKKTKRGLPWVPT